MTNIPILTTCEDLSPIIITSPIIRSGTTLVQRLLCSDPHTLIYGEMVGADFELQLNIFLSKAMFYSHSHDSFEYVRYTVIDQQQDRWMTNLLPDTTGYINALGKACFTGLYYCQHYALDRGCSTWGFKYPGWYPQTINMIRQSLPQARLIYIYRDIIECLKSAKSWQPSWSLQDSVKLCEEWIGNLEYALQLNDDRTLLIQYEGFVQQPITSLELLANFTGVQSVDATVLSRRLNGAQNGEGTYIQPTDLTDDELHIVQQTTTPLRKRLYGETISI